MPGLYAQSGGVNRQIKKLYANVGGVNRNLKELWAAQDGVNRKIFSGAVTWTYTATPSRDNVIGGKYGTDTFYVGPNETAYAQVWRITATDKIRGGTASFHFVEPVSLPELNAITVQALGQNPSNPFSYYVTVNGSTVLSKSRVYGTFSVNLSAPTQVSDISVHISTDSHTFGSGQDGADCSVIVTLFPVGRNSFILDSSGTSENQ